MIPYIAFDQVSKQFNQEVILDQVSFQLEQGKIYGMVGRNGSGKTVIFKLLCGLLRPTKGTIYHKGIAVSQSKAFLPSTGVLIETPGFIPHYSGLKNLKILNDLSQTRVSTQRVKECMTLTGLDPTSRKHVRTYSLGMTQKLGIAQAILNHPELLILDEPMNGLDEASVADIRALLLRLKEEGTTILLTSHNKEDITQLCDQIFAIQGGTLSSADVAVGCCP